MFKSVSTCTFCALALIPLSAVLLAARNITLPVTDQSGAAAPHGRISPVCPDTKETRTLRCGALLANDPLYEFTAPEVPQVSIVGFPLETRKQVAQAYAAARKRPRSADAVGNLAMLLDLYHRPQDAALCYRRAHLIQPTAFKWLYYWGSLLFSQKKMDEALPVLTSALQLRPEYLAARLRLGEALLEAGKTKEAGESYEGILKDHPDAAEAYYGLGRVQPARCHQAAAAEWYRKACELFPTYGAAHYRLAIAYGKLGRIREAQEQSDIHERNIYVVPPVADPLRDELRALDMSAATHLERGVQLEQVGRTDDAIAETEKALRLDPSLVKAHVNLLILYARTGRGQKAEEQYKSVLAEDAEKAFRKALAIAPSNDAAHNNLGYLLEREGKLSEAAVEYKKAIEVSPNSREAHFNLGRMLVTQPLYQE